MFDGILEYAKLNHECEIKIVYVRQKMSKIIFGVHHHLQTIAKERTKGRSSNIVHNKMVFLVPDFQVHKLYLYSKVFH